MPAKQCNYFFYIRYDILAEFHNNGKQVTLCKGPAYMGIKRNEEKDKAEKLPIDMSRMAMTRLPYAD